MKDCTMTPTQIKRKKIAIDKKIAKLNADIKALQAECMHVNAEHINRASTGNYDPSADEYWTDHNCHDCGKFWKTDQYWNRR